VADEGRVKQKFKIKIEVKSEVKSEVRVCALCAHTVQIFGFAVRIAHTAFACGVDFELPSPVHRLDPSQTSGDLGEDCLSTWTRSGSCEFRSPARL
jgi:hypothetical protein